eukprot:c14646_g1_i1 orf=52-777(+)
MAPATDDPPLGLSAHVDLTTHKPRQPFLAMPFTSFLLLIITFFFVVVDIVGFDHKSSCYVAAAPGFSSPDDSFRHGPKAIAAACNVTLYPALCIRSLSSYRGALSANPPGLVAISALVALRDVNRTYHIALSLSKGKGGRQEIAAVTDCVELMDDARDQLKLAASRLHNLDLKRAQMQLRDVQTWVSAALTYETTCSDGFEGMKGTVAQQMLQNGEGLSKMLSIALALVAHLSDHLVSWQT